MNDTLPLILSVAHRKLTTILLLCPDFFIKHFQRYQQNNPGVTLGFLPQTYRLSTESGQEDFKGRLFAREGINSPWVLKVSFFCLPCFACSI